LSLRAETKKLLIERDFNMHEQKLIDLIAFIKQNHFLLVKDNIFCLKAFISGWFFRADAFVEDEYSLELFQKWIQEKYNETETVHSWASIISYYSADEKLALSNFFKLFNEYYYYHFFNKEQSKNKESNEMTGTDDLLVLITLIKERTPMYIGKRSIFCLVAFINGWYFRNPKTVINRELLLSFEDWLFKKMKREKYSSSWYNLVNYYSSDESDALKSFFFEFEQYLITQKN
jgi:hypothetical protein